MAPKTSPVLAISNPTSGSSLLLISTTNGQIENAMSSSHRSRSRIPPSARSHAQGRMASLLGEDNNTFEPQNGVPSAFKWDSKRYEEEIARESEKVCDREGVLVKLDDDFDESDMRL